MKIIAIAVANPRLSFGSVDNLMWGTHRLFWGPSLQDVAAASLNTNGFGPYINILLIWFGHANGLYFTSN